MRIANGDKLDRLKGGATANGAVSAAVRVLGGLLLLREFDQLQVVRENGRVSCAIQRDLEGKNNKNSLKSA